MASKEKIGFIVDRKDVTDGHVRLTIRMLNSSKAMVKTNEMPIILNSIKASGMIDPKIQRGFTYTFPFELSQGHGFPYMLDMNFEDYGMLKLV